MRQLHKILVLCVALGSHFAARADNLMWLTVSPVEKCQGAPDVELRALNATANWTRFATYNPVCPDRGESVLLRLQDEFGSIFVQLLYQAKKKVDVLDSEGKQIATLFVQEGTVGFEGHLFHFSTMVNPKKRNILPGWIYGSDVYVFNPSLSNYTIDDSHLVTVANVTRTGNATQSHVIQVNYTGTPAMPLAMDPRVNVAIALARDFNWVGKAHPEKAHGLSTLQKSLLIATLVVVPVMVAAAIPCLAFKTSMCKHASGVTCAAYRSLQRTGPVFAWLAHAPQSAFSAARQALLGICNWQVLNEVEPAVAP